MTKSTFAYDAAADRGIPKAAIPAASLDSVNTMAGVVDGTAYLSGGLAQNTGTYCSHTATLAYDPVQDRFVGKRRLPAPCAAAGCAVIGHKIYLVVEAD